MPESAHPHGEGIFGERGELFCGTPNCGKKLGVAKDGTTVLRCPSCKTDNAFSVPIYLARALEHSCRAQDRLAEALLLVAQLSAR